MSVKEFFNNIPDHTMYKGMLERIGRTIIWGNDIIDNGFFKFMKTPLEYGAAIEQGAFEEISSRPWEKNFQSSTDGAKNPLFDTQLPRYINEIAKVNFSREIPLKMSELEFRKCCQTAETIGDVAGALIGKINITFMDDMYEACKQYFCGCFRIAPEPSVDTEEEAKMPVTLNEIISNPMIEIIDYETKENLEDEILRRIHNIADSEFYYKSRKYNPAGRYVHSRQMTLIMPKKWKYQLFMEKFAATFHPEYIKLGPEVTPLYIDDMPQMSKGLLPLYDPEKETGYEYFGMLVDDRALGITPLNGGFSVQTFHNPSENSTSYFGHYEMIFSFASLFNRKYIFLHKKYTKESFNKKIKNLITFVYRNIWLFAPLCLACKYTWKLF